MWPIVVRKLKEMPNLGMPKETISYFIDIALQKIMENLGSWSEIEFEH